LAVFLHTIEATMFAYLRKCEPPSDRKRRKFVAATMRTLGNEKHALIEALHTLQQVLGYFDKPGFTGETTPDGYLSGLTARRSGVTDLAQPWRDAESCTSWGKCVHVCPIARWARRSLVAEITKRRQYLPYSSLMRGERQ
jgi:hypothetical protein